MTYSRSSASLGEDVPGLFQKEGHMGNPAAYTPFLDRFVLERICRRTDSGGFHQLLGRYIMGSLKGSNLTNVKRQNESAIRDVIYRYGPISRSEIAQMLSLTPPTITTV